MYSGRGRAGRGRAVYSGRGRLCGMITGSHHHCDLCYPKMWFINGPSLGCICIAELELIWLNAVLFIKLLGIAYCTCLCGMLLVG